MGILHRRHLRVKVVQALYASRFNDTTGGIGTKPLFQSMDKVYDLYLMLLQSLVELHGFAEAKLEGSKQKYVPTENDINPNMNFVNNKVLGLLVNNGALYSWLEDKRLSWNDEELEMLKKCWRNIQESDEFDSYMQLENPTFEQDQKFIETIFKKFIANNEILQEYFMEESIFWVDDLDLVCINVLKTIEGLQEEKGPSNKLKPLFKNQEEDKEFAKKLLLRSQAFFDENLALISEYAKNWEIDRIATMDQIIMNMAVTEAKVFNQIPIKVTMNEYLEMAKSYSTPKSNNFINGVLDKIFKLLQEQGKIKKIGRGLIN